MRVRKHKLAWILGCAALAASTFAPPASAQQKKYKRVETAAPTTREETQVRSMLTGSVLVKEQIDKVLLHYLAMMTREEEFSTIAEKRNAIKFQFAARASSGPVHDYVVQKSFETASGMLSPEYHPITRMEAALLIGDMNKVETVSVGDKRTWAVPFAPALDVLLDVVGKADSTESVVAAALLGIDRHARLAVLDDKKKEQIQGALLKIVGSESQHVWNRRRALRALGNLRRLGPKNETLNAIAGILNNPKAPFELKTEAARTLGLLDLRDVRDFDLAKVSYPAAQLAVDAAKTTSAGNLRWTEDQLDALRQTMAHLHVGFHGIDPKMTNPLIDGPTPEGCGLIAGAAKSKTDIHNAMTALAPKVNQVYEMLVGREIPQNKDLADAVTQLDSFLQATGNATASTSDGPAGR